MNTLANNRFLNSSLAIGGVLLIAALCACYMNSIQGFIEQATNMFFLASRAASRQLDIVPLH